MRKLLLLVPLLALAGCTRYEGPMEVRKKKARAAGRRVALIQSMLPKVVQLTAQFIRALRNGITVGMRWLAAVEILRGAMKAYL